MTDGEDRGGRSRLPLVGVAHVEQVALPLREQEEQVRRVGWLGVVAEVSVPGMQAGVDLDWRAVRRRQSDQVVEDGVFH